MVVHSFNPWTQEEVAGESPSPYQHGLQRKLQATHRNPVSTTTEKSSKKIIKIKTQKERKEMKGKEKRKGKKKIGRKKKSKHDSKDTRMGLGFFIQDAHSG